MREKWSEEMYKRLPEIPTLIDFDEWLTTKTKGKDWDVWFHGPRQDQKSTESKDDKTLQASKNKTKKAPVEKSTIDLVTTNATPNSSQSPANLQLEEKLTNRCRPISFVLQIDTRLKTAQCLRR